MAESEQTKLSDPFVDVDFCAYAAIGNEFMSETVKSWRRPKEVWAGVELKLFSECTILQGEVNDCWFLGALSSCFNNNILQNLVTNSDLESGRYTIRFFKKGNWIDVTVDDQLPCGEDGNPVFCNSSIPGVLWPLIFEKAYAKLHTCYAALNGGSEGDAFVDLTGGIPTLLDLKHPSNADVDALWKKLFDHKSKSNLIGASHFDPITAEDNSSAPGDRKIRATVTLDPSQPPAELSFTRTESAEGVAQAFIEKYNLPSDQTNVIANFIRQHQADATKFHEERQKNPNAVRAAAREKASNRPELLTNHTYAISDMKEEGNVVQMTNPWGVGGVPPEATDVTNDGKFWLQWDHFLRLFNAITILNRISKPKRQLVIEGKWAPSVGYANRVEAQQFLFQLASESRVTVLLEQGENRMRGGRNNFQPIGVDVCEPDSDCSSAGVDGLVVAEEGCRGGSKPSTYASVFVASRQVAIEDMVLAEGKHVIIPMTYAPGVENSFMLRVYIF